MNSKPIALIITWGLLVTILLAGFYVLTGWAALGEPVLNPPRNSHTAPLTTTVSITYDAPISPTTVTSRTFVVHGMQSGSVTANYGVRGGTIVLTSTQAFRQGELAYAIATTGILGLDGTDPLAATQWQFNAGQVESHTVRCFNNIGAGLVGVGQGSAAWGDYDRDGDLDILLTGRDDGHSHVSKIYRNEAGTFVDIGAGLLGVDWSSTAWGDYDNDGDLDILLTGRDDGGSPVSKIYRNEVGTFVDVGAGLPDMFTGSVAWGDYDNDGNLDLLLTGGHSRIYRNGGPEAGWTFNDVGAGLQNVLFSSVAWGDYDSDGDLDILLTGGVDEWTPRSYIYRNNGPGAGWTFSSITTELMHVCNSSVAWGDYDNDSDLDILLTGSTEGCEPGITPASLVYRNDGPATPAGWTFTPITVVLPYVQESSVAWGDYDNDGDLDILLTGQHTGSGVYRNDGPSSDTGWTFTDVEAGLQDVSYSSARWGDYDNDSDLDILLTGMADGGPVSIVYRNYDCRPDLVITKTVTPELVMPGQIITYTLTFFNAGLGPATGILITDAIPISVTNTSVVSSGTAITQVNPGYVWQVHSLASSQGGVISVTGLITQSLTAGIFTNTVVITCTEIDSSTSNNTSSTSVTIERWRFYLPLVVDRAISQ